MITAESTRLSRLVDNLLDLSRLEAGAAEPRPRVVLDRGGRSTPRSTTSGSRRSASRSSLDRDLPLVRADAAQLERAFANLLENGARYSGGHPVSVRGARRPAGGCSCASSTAGPASRPRSASASSSPSTAPAARAPATAARASGWRSCAGSWRPTAARSRSSRCPARARASWSSSRPSCSPTDAPPSTRPRR